MVRVRAISRGEYALMIHNEGEVFEYDMAGMRLDLCPVNPKTGEIEHEKTCRILKDSTFLTSARGQVVLPRWLEVVSESEALTPFDRVPPDTAGHRTKFDKNSVL